ncbi:hypothetical protein GCM10023340_31420 [Nocardioides marinquilinus]|uniref:Uncharacterized protein n=1 Tax=Nocardioides marinquilinus TaxID=1210400 RepID=A0ABP9PUR0_9ACTN
MTAPAGEGVRFDAGPTADGAGPPFTGSLGQGRAVWTGRFPGLAPGGHDGFDTMVGHVGRLLDECHEVVVLDPMSFPWRTWQSHPRSTTPVVVRVPGALDAEGAADLLDKPMLRRATAHDRLLVRRPDVAAGLCERYGLPASCCLLPEPDEAERADWWHGPLARRVAAAPEADDALRRAKETLELELEVVMEQLATVPVPFGSTALRVHGFGDAVRTRLLGYRSVEEVQLVDGDAERPGPSLEDRLTVPSPHAGVVWFADGGEQDDARRHAALAEAHRRLDPGGRLLVVGWVVDGPQGRNPSVSALCTQVLDATGGAVHLDELRGFRHPADPMTRAVLTAWTRLGPGERA